MGDRVAIGRIRRDLGTVAETGISTFQWRAEWMELGKREEALSLCCVVKELPQGKRHRVRRKSRGLKQLLGLEPGEGDAYIWDVACTHTPHSFHNVSISVCRACHSCSCYTTAAKACLFRFRDGPY